MVKGFFKKIFLILKKKSFNGEVHEMESEQEN